ncbi:unnamed protein product [Rhizoctonia solani]|uniref:Uncharacterized protein n=2 Tax=Rhizoctonia solani TaxID=456999 RepID=A0A8H2X2U2_9AGAM
MSSSKRKTPAGGYEDSSDFDFDDEKAYRDIPLGQGANKRPKSSSPALPGLSGNPTLSRFLLPQVDSLRKQFTGYTTPTPEPASSSQDWVVVDSPTPRVSDSVGKGDTRSSRPTAQLDAATGAKPRSLDREQPEVRMRPSISFERQINTLATSIEEGKKQAEERYDELSSKLDQVLAAIRRLEALNQASGGSVPTLNTVPVNHEECANPKPTDELREIVVRVVSGSRLRVGNKKGGAHENSFKDHARVAWYRMLKITASKDIRPFFENAYGEPDTLPAFAKDPRTGYCMPYPHWKVPLTKQLLWIPTYIAGFRGTIPNDNSELSCALRNHSDEQIVTLLCDGSFKTACSKWRELGFTPEETSRMRSQARRYQRTVRKSDFRKAHIATNLLQLQGPDWEHLTHPGFISDDESGSDGELTTVRPGYRGKWANNIADAMNAAGAEQGPTKSNARVRARHISIVDRPIPQLQRGSGAGSVPVYIAACSLSKAWRDTHPDELKEAVHLINFKLSTKPSIDDFLSQHPMGPPSAGTDGADGLDANDFPIDPELLQGENPPQVNTAMSETEDGSSTPSPAQAGGAGSSALMPNSFRAVHSFEMPPPPVLDGYISTPEPDVPAKKRGRPKKVTTDTTELAGRTTRASDRTSTQTQQPEAQVGEVSQVKKRGRPLGSKNKK